MVMLWLIKKFNLHEKIKCNNFLKRIKRMIDTLMLIRQYEEHGENFNWPELIQAILRDKAFMSGRLLAIYSEEHGKLSVRYANTLC